MPRMKHNAIYPYNHEGEIQPQMKRRVSEIGPEIHAT